MRKKRRKKVEEGEEEQERKERAKGEGGRDKQLPVCAWRVSPSRPAGCAGAGWWCHSQSVSAAVPHAALTGGVHSTVGGEEANNS